MSRFALIVARMQPGSEAEIARVFAESDATELPRLGRVRHRSLFRMGEDLYFHLVETELDAGEAVSEIREHPLFREISERLAAYITPYNPATWRSPRDAFAVEFYSWDAPG